MRRCYVLGALLSLASSSSFAGFALATFDEPGGHQESFAYLVATGRSDVDEHTLRPLAIPFADSMTASFAPSHDTTVSYAHQSLFFYSDRLELDITDFHFVGPVGVGSEGHWLFTVNQPTNTVVFGALHVASASANQSTLNSTLADLTAGITLYESYQFDTASSGDYFIGGITNPLYGRFRGSLNNTLVPAHIYRLTYAFSSDGPGAGAGPSNSTGQLVLATVLPEPVSYTLLLGGLLAVAFFVRQRKI